MRPHRRVSAALFVLATLLLLPALRAQDEPRTAGTEGVPVPKKIRHVQPVYPPEAQEQGIRGIVILELVLDTQGRVSAVSIIRSVPGLDEAALAAARQWEDEVTKVEGKPLWGRLTVPSRSRSSFPTSPGSRGFRSCARARCPGRRAGHPGGRWWSPRSPSTPTGAAAWPAWSKGKRRGRTRWCRRSGPGASHRRRRTSRYRSASRPRSPPAPGAARAAFRSASATFDAAPPSPRRGKRRRRRRRSRLPLPPLPRRRGRAPHRQREKRGRGGG